MSSANTKPPGAGRTEVVTAPHPNRGDPCGLGPLGGDRGRLGTAQLPERVHGMRRKRAADNPRRRPGRRPTQPQPLQVERIVRSGLERVLDLDAWLDIYRPTLKLS